MTKYKERTINRLRALDIIERGQTIPITYKGRDDLFRKAMAGEQMLTPLTLYIYMTGRDQETFGRVELGECTAALRRHGYKPDRAVTEFGRGAKRVWIRTEVWPEDEYWDEQVKIARRNAQALIGLLDLAEEIESCDADDDRSVVRNEAARAVD
ncbi:hypothetical protein FHS51_004184 [Sphingobium wenxiniae]|uniref:Uncharacterized protein n=1 Tax=Sphingobium wenxiniae (strain DSM 21828 / CGMCC 1.7748 / JZ-1) TaxID=595605 RepID=A0A562JW23_SPHWJ|nr:hypothetical protein [Sphingobium wenxiniae]MBB6193925.1 hypothetical protein [Sphingobium wenxiniae]TWH87173.1 hypothetical protein IQ35_04005 [Sphingobium wenxiniae]